MRYVYQMNKLVEIIDNIIEYAGKHYENLVVTLYAVYFVLFFGIINIDPEYINDLRWAMQVFVCVFLIYRFNPLKTHVLKPYDAKIIFSSALFLLVNTGLVELFERYWKEMPITSVMG